MLRSVARDPACSTNRRSLARLLGLLVVVAVLLGGIAIFAFLTPRPIHIGGYALVGPRANFADLGGGYFYANVGGSQSGVESVWFQIPHTGPVPGVWQQCWQWRAFTCWRREPVQTRRIGALDLPRLPMQKKGGAAK